MKRLFLLFVLPVLPVFFFYSCHQPTSDKDMRVRQLVDTVGFAQYDWQMDSLFARIERYRGDSLARWTNKDFSWRMCISPHDDYTYAGWLYPAVLSHVKAPVVLMFGVAHKARLLNLQDKIVTGTYPAWKGIYGNIRVSPLRNEIFNRLDSSLYVVNDSMITIEHSLEALLPFLQYYNRRIEIIPVLVPYMDYYRMDEISRKFADALRAVMESHHLTWGKDLAIVISTDAVHYGDEDWGGKNYAVYGTDSAGTADARKHEFEIIKNCLTGPVLQTKAKLFTQYTVRDDDYKIYKWTWCGRYSVPFGLLTGFHLQQALEAPPLGGILIGYASSIDHTPIPVDDIRMGITAPANNHHWVGYTAVGYK
ncbi:MAG: AmmeMemoRadiSam system protein B [Chlorobi bacterium]|nr:AmmeMemoRadiSam system protein B [Chlorobiota bacterium]